MKHTEEKEVLTQRETAVAKASFQERLANVAFAHSLKSDAWLA